MPGSDQYRESGEPRQPQQGCFSTKCHSSTLPRADSAVHSPHPTTWSLPALAASAASRDNSIHQLNHSPAIGSLSHRVATQALRLPKRLPRCVSEAEGAADNSHCQWDKLKRLCVSLAVAVVASSNTLALRHSRRAHRVTLCVVAGNLSPSPAICHLIAIPGLNSSGLMYEHALSLSETIGDTAVDEAGFEDLKLSKIVGYRHFDCACLLQVLAEIALEVDAADTCTQEGHWRGIFSRHTFIMSGESWPNVQNDQVAVPWGARARNPQSEQLLFRKPTPRGTALIGKSIFIRPP